MGNKFKEQLIVIPEDDANRDLANGFVRAMSPQKHRNIWIESSAGGWLKAVEACKELDLASRTKWVVVLLIDFDGKFPARLAEIKADIDSQLHSRVFVLGSADEAETINSGRKLETTGRELGEACASAASTSPGSRWMMKDLAHNAPELTRLCTAVGSLLF